MYRKKARVYTKRRGATTEKILEYIPQYQEDTQNLCRQSYNSRLGTLVKSKRCDQMGVAPLKEGNILPCDPKHQSQHFD